MNLVQDLQMCICFSIIQETPRHLTPKEFAQSLQRVIKELEASTCECRSAFREAVGMFDLLERSESAGNEKSVRQSREMLSQKPENIAIKCHEKLLSKKSIHPEVQKGVNPIHVISSTARAKDESQLAPPPPALPSKVAPEQSVLPLPVYEPSEGSGATRVSVILPLRKRNRCSLPSEGTLPTNVIRIHPYSRRIREIRPVVEHRRHHPHHKNRTSAQSVDKSQCLSSKKTDGIARKIASDNLQQPSFQSSARGGQSIKEHTLSLHPKEPPSFLEEFGYVKYFIICQKRVEALEFILNDFWGIVQLTLFRKRMFSERAIEEMFEVIRLSEENDLERILNLCLKLYTNILRVLTNLHLLNDIDFDSVRKIFDVIKRIPRLHWRHLEACGERTTQFLCYLLELNVRGYFVDNIGFSATDLLSDIVTDIKKIIENEVTPSYEVSLNLIDVAMDAVSRDEHFRGSNTEDRHCSSAYLKACLERWKWMLEDERPLTFHQPSLFLMQVDSLLQLID